MQARYIFLITAFGLLNYLHASVLANNLMPTKDSCTYQLHGLVYDINTRAILPGALVRLLYLQSQIATTGVDGHFVMDNLCRQKYTYVASFVGYKPDTLVGFPVHDLVFRLSPLINILQTVRIDNQYLPERKFNAFVSLPTTTLSGKALEQNFGQPLGQILQTLPGMQALQTGPTIFKPIVRGLYGNRVLIINNGVRLEGQQWGSEHAPEIDPFSLGSITVLRGASGARYGPDALSGVIITAPPVFDDSSGHKISVFGGYGSNSRLYSHSLMAEKTYRKSNNTYIGVRGQVSQRRAGNSSAPNLVLDNTGLSEQNFSFLGKVVHKSWEFNAGFSRFFSKIGIFSGSHIGNTTDLVERLNGIQQPPAADFTYKIGRPYQNIIHSTLNASAKKTFANTSTLEILGSVQHNLRQEYDNHARVLANRPEYIFSIFSHGLDINWESAISGKWHWQAGLSGQYQDNFARTLIPDFTLWQAGIYAIGKTNISQNLVFEMGARGDGRDLQTQSYSRLAGQSIVKAGQHRYQNLSLIAGLIYQPAPQYLISYNAASGWRAPAPNELYADGVHHAEAIYLLGKADLIPERAYNQSLGLVFSRPNLKIETEVYANYIQNFVYQQPQSRPMLTIRGAFPAFSYQAANALLAGTDVQLQQWWAGKRLQTIASGSLLYARNISEQQWLPLMPPARADLSFYYNGGCLGFLHSTSVFGGLLAVARQTRFAINQDFALPPKGYVLPRMGLNADMLTGNGQVLSCSVQIQNPFGLTYRNYLNRMRYYAPEQGQNILLNLKWAFAG